MAGNVKEITDQSFDTFVDDNNVAVIDFWAAWCGPCRLVGPVVEDLAGEFAGKISFGKLDVDANRNVPTKFGIMSIPTLLVFKNGKQVDSIVGALPKEIIKRKLQKFIK